MSNIMATCHTKDLTPTTDLLSAMDAGSLAADLVRSAVQHVPPV